MSCGCHSKSTDVLKDRHHTDMTQVVSQKHVERRTPGGKLRTLSLPDIERDFPKYHELLMRMSKVLGVSADRLDGHLHDITTSDHSMGAGFWTDVWGHVKTGASNLLKKGFDQIVHDPVSVVNFVKSLAQTVPVE